MFRDQKRPREQDPKFDGKYDCLLKLELFIPKNHLQAYKDYFKPFVGPASELSSMSNSNGGATPGMV